MATLVSFWSLFGNRMADLGLIDSKLGLYIKINVNNRQNKFEVHISKTVAILWPKIGQRHFGARASHGHNLAIFHQILTNEHTKMTSSLRRIEWNKILNLSSISLFYILVFWLYFCSEASHGQCCTYGLKTTLKLLVHVLAIMAGSYLKIVFLQKSGLLPKRGFLEEAWFWGVRVGFGGRESAVASALINDEKISFYMFKNME